MSNGRIGAVAGLPVLRIPRLFAVVEALGGQVVARGLEESVARGVAEGWKWTHGPAELIEERLTWPSDDQVRSQRQVAR
jgi:hypothetical protein